MFIFKLKYKSQVWVWKATGRLLSLVRSWCAVGGRGARLGASPGGTGASRSAGRAPEELGWDLLPLTHPPGLGGTSSASCVTVPPHTTPRTLSLSVCFSLLIPPPISTYRWSCCTIPLPLLHFLWITLPLTYPNYPFLCQHILLLLLHFMLASCNWFRQWFTLKPRVRTESKMVKRLRLKPHFQSPTWRSCRLLIPDFLVFQLPAIWWVCEFWNISFTRIKKAKFSHYCMSKKWRKKPLSSLKNLRSFPAFPYSPRRTSSRRQFQAVLAYICYGSMSMECNTGPGPGGNFCC